MTTHPDSPKDQSPSTLADRLAHAMTTACNDDYSEPRSRERERHCARIEAMEAAVATLRSADQSYEAGREAGLRRFKHVRRGTTYVEIGRGELQKTFEPSPEEGCILVAYRSEKDGRLWFRRATEFDDGRFEELPPVARATRQPKPDPGEGELNYYRAEGTGDTICIRCEFNLSTYLRERIDAAVRAERERGDGPRHDRREGE